MRGGIIEENVHFCVEGSLLEGVLAYPAKGTPRRAALVLAPHPHFGGNMSNNVVSCLACGLAQRETVALRFNYRGIGDSEGPPEAIQGPYQYWNALEQERRYEELLPDVVGAWRWLKQSLGEPVPFLMVGYSLGAILAGMAAPALAPDGIAAICPPTNRLHMTAYRQLQQPKLFLHGDRDFAFDGEAFTEEYEHMPPPKQSVLLRNADHFLRKEEERLLPHLSDWLKSMVIPGQASSTPSN